MPQFPRGSASTLHRRAAAVALRLTSARILYSNEREQHSAERDSLEQEREEWRRQQEESGDLATRLADTNAAQRSRPLTFMLSKIRAIDGPVMLR